MTGEAEIYVISLFGSADDGEYILLHQCALKTWPSDLASGLMAASDEAARILSYDADLRNQATRCEIHRATPEEATELESAGTVDP